MSTDTYPISQVEGFVERIDELEAEAERSAADEAWAHANTVLVEFQPIEKGWEASVWDRENVMTSCEATIHAALRALRAKVEMGGQ